MLAAAIARNDPATPTCSPPPESSHLQGPFALKDDDWMPYSPDKALELIAWTPIDPDGPEATKTLDRMLNDRNPYGHWRSTWVNGWSLIAMGLYAEHEKDRGESIALNLETNDGAETIQLSPETPTAIRTPRARAEPETQRHRRPQRVCPPPRGLQTADRADPTRRQQRPVRSTASITASIRTAPPSL